MDTVGSGRRVCEALGLALKLLPAILKGQGTVAGEVPPQLWDIRAGIAACEAGFAWLPGTESQLRLAKAVKEIHWLGELLCPARVSGMLGLSRFLRPVFFCVGVLPCQNLLVWWQESQGKLSLAHIRPCAQFLKQSLVARGMECSHWPGLEQGAGSSPSQLRSLMRGREEWLSTKKRCSGHSQRNNEWALPGSKWNSRKCPIPEAAHQKLGVCRRLPGRALLERRPTFLLLGE